MELVVTGWELGRLSRSCEADPAGNDDGSGRDGDDGRALHELVGMTMTSGIARVTRTAADRERRHCASDHQPITLRDRLDGARPSVAHLELLAGAAGARRIAAYVGVRVVGFARLLPSGRH